MLYTGVTNDLQQRMFQHKQAPERSFTGRYNVNRLVYFEAGDSIDAAIAREKQLKGWRRAWKVALIERENPQWRDLYEEICQ